MNYAKRVLVIVAALVWMGTATRAQAPKRAITFEDLISMRRISDPRISPDGKWIAYSVATPDKEANRLVKDVWMVFVAGDEPRQLTRGGSDERPRWSPDSTRIAFLSTRDGTPQIYWIALEGGEARRLTSLSTGTDNELWSPDGNWIAFVSSVYPDCKDDDCNRLRDAEKEKSKVKARIYDRLLFRHWNAWWDGKRSHLFVVPANGGTPRDLTPGADYDVPPFNLDSPEAITFSPDSKEICFTANTDRDTAISTNGDLFTVPVSGATAPARITTNPGDDWGPAYSPDGKFIAYRAQFIPGYESDRWRLMLYDRQKGDHINLTEKFDRSIEALAWSPDGRRIYFQGEDRAEMPLYAIAAEPTASPKAILRDSYNTDFDVGKDGKLAFTRTGFTMPAEVFAANSDGSDIRQLTHHNSALLGQLDLGPAERFHFKGANDTQVEGWLIRPPHFDPAKNYPMLLLVHGGPQGVWADNWGYRWNPEVMAAPGYVVVMINPRGSTGYGHKFEEEISKDWGGKVYVDLMKGVDAALEKFPFIDGSRMCAAGGSYGGFMVNWMATHTDRFKCMISH